MAARPDRRNLTQKVPGGTFYAVMEAPRDLRAEFGKRRLIESLHTDSLTEAVKRKHGVLVKFQAQFDAARGKPPADDAAGSAMAWRAVLAPLPPGPERDGALFGLDEEADERFGHGAAFGDDHTGSADAFLGIATGTRTPIGLYLDKWLAQGNKGRKLRPATDANYRRSMSVISVYLNRQGITTAEAVTRRVAGNMVDAMQDAGMTAGTINTRLTAASAYWRWLLRRGVLPEGSANPWHGQNVAEDDDAKRRAFTDAEVGTMLARAGSTRSTGDTADTLRVLLLSGLRVGELCRLRVSDCADGWFTVDGKGGKERRVPTHSDLTSIVARRTNGKAPDAPLFPGRGGRVRVPATVSGDYSRRMRAWGLASDDRTQSDVTLHSTRKWFVTAARRHADRNTVAAIVGHTAQDMTDGTYNSGPSDGMMRAAVEAVRLPV